MLWYLQNLKAYDAMYRNNSGRNDTPPMKDNR